MTLTEIIYATSNSSTNCGRPHLNEIDASDDREFEIVEDSRLLDADRDSP